MIRFCTHCGLRYDKPGQHTCRSEIEIAEADAALAAANKAREDAEAERDALRDFERRYSRAVDPSMQRSRAEVIEMVESLSRCLAESEAQRATLLGLLRDESRRLGDAEGVATATIQRTTDLCNLIAYMRTRIDAALEAEEQGGQDA